MIKKNKSSEADKRQTKNISSVLFVEIDTELWQPKRMLSLPIWENITPRMPQTKATAWVFFAKATKPIKNGGEAGGRNF